MIKPCWFQSRVLADFVPDFVPSPDGLTFLQVRCEVDVDSNTCITCKAAGAECMWASQAKLRPALG
jgi:hypothetical protein